MNKREKLLNSLPVIVEAFVNVYGENYRVIIEETIYNRINFVVFQNDDVIDYDDTFKYVDEYDYLLECVDRDYTKEFCGANYGFTVFNFVSLNGVDVVKPTVLLFTDNEMLDDLILLHEINHCIEASIYYSKGKKIFKNSWAELEYNDNYGDLVDYFCNPNLSSLLLDECINDLISEDVYNYLLNLNIKILDEGKTEEYIPDNINNGVYNAFKPLIREFYRKYKDLIIKSRICLSSKLENSLGKDNINELNNIALEFENYFYELDDNMLIIDLDKFENEKDKILEFKNRIDSLLNIIILKCKVKS